MLRATACKDVTIKACHSPAGPSALHMQQRSSHLPFNTMHSRRKQHPRLGMLMPACGSQLQQQTGQPPGLELAQKTCHLQGLRNWLSLPAKQQSSHMQTRPTVLSNAFSFQLHCKGQTRPCLRGKVIWPQRLIVVMNHHHVVTLHQKHHMAVIAGQMHLNQIILTRCQHQITLKMSRRNQVALLHHHQPPAEENLLHNAQCMLFSTSQKCVSCTGYVDCKPGLACSNINSVVSLQIGNVCVSLVKCLPS